MEIKIPVKRIFNIQYIKNSSSGVLNVLIKLRMDEIQKTYFTLFQKVPWCVLKIKLIVQLVHL